MKEGLREMPSSLIITHSWLGVVVHTFGRHRKEDCKFEASLGYIVKLSQKTKGSLVDTVASTVGGPGSISSTVNKQTNLFSGELTQSH
jgi:hypothetical protein